jgi:hypothetical protein
MEEGEPMPYPCTSQTETRRLIGVLQQWQVLLASASTPACLITLADVQEVILALQQTFGPSTTLETMIQHLVGQDLREQIERRQAQASKRVADTAA